MMARDLADENTAHRQRAGGSAGGNEAGRLICGKWRRGLEMLGSGVRAGAGLDALTDEDALFSDSCVIWRPSCSSAGGASRPQLPI